MAGMIAPCGPGATLLPRMPPGPPASLGLGGALPATAARGQRSGTLQTNHSEQSALRQLLPGLGTHQVLHTSLTFAKHASRRALGPWSWEEGWREEGGAGTTLPGTATVTAPHRWPVLSQAGWSRVARTDGLTAGTVSGRSAKMRKTWPPKQPLTSMTARAHATRACNKQGTKVQLLAQEHAACVAADNSRTVSFRVSNSPTLTSTRLTTVRAHSSRAAHAARLGCTQRGGGRGSQAALKPVAHQPAQAALLQPGAQPEPLLLTEGHREAQADGEGDEYRPHHELWHEGGEWAAGWICRPGSAFILAGGPPAAGRHRVKCPPCTAEGRVAASPATRWLCSSNPASSWLGGPVQSAWHPDNASSVRNELGDSAYGPVGDRQMAGQQLPRLLPPLRGCNAGSATCGQLAALFSAPRATPPRLNTVVPESRPYECVLVEHCSSCLAVRCSISQLAMP